MSNAAHSPEQAVRTMQIIAGALLLSVVLFAVIAVLGLGALNEEPDGQIISMLAAVMTGLELVALPILPKVVVRQQIGEPDPNDVSSLYGVYQAQMIIRLALLEGMAFFNIIACIIEHNWWSLAIAAGLVAWMLLGFPNRERVDQWIEIQRMNLGAGDFNR